MDLEVILKDLVSLFVQLKDLRDEMLYYATEEQLLASTIVFREWMESVAFIEVDVKDIMAEAERLNLRWRLCPWFQGCCGTNYEFRKRVVKTIEVVKDLSTRRDMIIPTKKPSFRKLQPEGIYVGLDSYFEQVMCFLQEDNVSVMGLYGMGGVGKTSLLKKINNHICNTGYSTDYVLWVTIGCDVNMRWIQKAIGKGIGLIWREGEDMSMHAQNIYDALSEKCYVLLLDDIWERIDLRSIGIPSPRFGYKSKIVFTTRSELVCGMMEVDRKLRVECLNMNQAWELFKSRVGPEILHSHSEIPLLAKKVVKECGGLPLMLIIIGRVMSSKTTPQEWNHAVRTLHGYTAEFSGVEPMVFSMLKISYDDLPSNYHRSCFLFCSLYPKGHQFDVDDLIRQWIGQRCIGEYDDLEEAFSCGYDILGLLKAVCLLESRDNYVKMHDIIHDMGHWIACECGGRKDKVLVTAGEGFTKAPKVLLDEWVMVEEMSVMHTHITELDDIPESPNLLTLLLCGNRYLTHIHDDFFIHMSLLRFLDLSSNIKLEAVPKSIVELVMLEYLDLSGTSIKEVPQEMKNLSRMRYLFLNCIYSPPKVPVGVIGVLSDLRMLGLSVNSFGDCENDRLAGILELGRLARVGSLKIAISNFKELESYLGNDRLVQYTTYLSIDGEQDETRKGLSKLSLSPSSSCTSLGYMSRLRSLRICRCREMEQLVVDDMDIGLLYSLEKMVLRELPRLVVSWDMKNDHGPHFINLHDICVDGCDFMVNLTWLLWVPRLQTLKVNNCQMIEEIITNDSIACDNTFSHLVLLILDNLQSLRSICRSALLFPCLNEIVVADCPQLRRLPLDLNSNNSQRIAGSFKWWDNLEWENESIKSRFDPFFTEAPELT